jgi:hypothetical protein
LRGFALAGFTVARRRLGKRGVALIISGLVLIMITVTAGVLFYVYANRVLGNLLNVNPQETMDNLRIEAYNWDTLGTLVLNVRNTGTNILTMTTAQWFLAGVLQTTASGCTGTLSPGVLCTETITVSGVTPAAGIVYVVKVVLSDGAIFATSAIAGQVTGQTGVT